MLATASPTSSGLLVLVAATLVAGLLLLLAGHRLLPALLGICGFLLAATIGHAVGEVFAPRVSPWMMALPFGVVGAILGALSARLAAALLLALLLALAGWMSVGALERHGFLGDPADARPEATVAAEADDADERLEADADRLAILIREARRRIAELGRPIHTAAVDERIGEVWGVAGAGVSSLRRQWDDATPPVRTLMGATAAMCAFVGLCAGLLAARTTSALVTAALGALLLIGAAAALLALRTGEPLEIDRRAWILAWVVLAALGAVVQALTIRGPKTRREPKPT